MTAILSRLPPEDSEKIARLVQAAFTDGLQRAYWLVLALAIMGFLATYFLNAKKLGHTTG